MKDDVLEFTEGLSELLKSGLDLPQSLDSIKSDISSELSERIAEGEKFSVALMSCRSALFPDWYVGFVSASECGGNLVRTVSHLAVALKERKILREKFIGAVFYPLAISILTGICGLIAVLSFSSVLGDFSDVDAASSFQREALRSCIYGGLFLSVVAFFVVIVLRRLMSPDPCASFFSSLSFLTDCGVPIIPAIDSSMSVIGKSKSLSDALFQTRMELMGGSDVSGAFSSALFDAGFRFESNLARSNLSVSELSGNTAAFSKIAETISKKRERFRATVLSLEQPILLCAAAIYLVIVMKSTVMRAMFPAF